MRPEGSSSSRSLLVIAIVVIVVIVVAIVVDRAQEMEEGPLVHVATLPSSLQVRKAELDTGVDAGINYVRGCIREAVIRACSLVGGWVICGRYGEGHFVGPKEESKHTGYGASDVVGPGRVLRIVRIIL